MKSLLQKSWFFVSPAARQRYIFQALSYKIGKAKNRDDILDACAYIEEARRPENWSTIKSHPLSGPVLESGILLGADLPF